MLLTLDDGEDADPSSLSKLLTLDDGKMLIPASSWMVWGLFFAFLRPPKTGNQTKKLSNKLSESRKSDKKIV